MHYYQACVPKEIFSEVINEKMKTLSTPFDFPSDVKTTKEELQKAQKKEKELKKEKLLQNSKKFQER